VTELTTTEFIYDLDYAQVEAILLSWSEPRYRAQQIWKGLYQHLWNRPEQFTQLPVQLRSKLSQEFGFTQLKPIQTVESSDGETRKTLFELPDGQAIEAVLMRYGQPGSARQRRTLCISTQAGCGMGCTFCATGQMGFRRHLSSGEIIEQVLYYARQLAEIDEQVTNVVLMGMGEPFHNYEATLGAIDRLNDPNGFNFGARRFTISTVGLIPMIRRFANERRQVNLAISLHAVDDELRSSMLPINKKYPIQELLATCRDYVKKTNRRITFEWALIYGVNDTPETARQLGQLLQGMLCHVNVIPLNPTQGFQGQATTRERAQAFREELEKVGIPCTIRMRRGIDIQAGCGQLATANQKKAGRHDQ
jgi:23S rRNA (adenine2503-C2)-methyltransferase